VNRLLLSLWLLGAALFAGSALVSMHAIFGWPYSKPTIDAANMRAPSLGNAERAPSVAEAEAHGEALPLPPMPPASREQPAPEPLQEQRTAAAQAEPEQKDQSLHKQDAAGSAATGSQDEEGAWVKVLSRGANLRAGPSSSAPRLTSFPADTELRALAREKGWVQVADADGAETGWIYEKLLDPIAPPPQAGEAADDAEYQGESVRVSEPAAAVRAGPSSEAAMLFGFPHGRELRVMSREPGWVEIMDLGSRQTGWIAEGSLAPGGAEQEAAIPQRKNRGAYPDAQAAAEWSGQLPWDENMGQRNSMEQPQKRARKRGLRRNGVFADALRRAFGGF
jgi:SH3-like domain-containing protein